MPNEIEAKMKVADHAPTRERLRAAGATFVGRTLETNRFFDTPTGALKAGGTGLRLRINHNLDTGVDQAVVTYKGPRQQGEFKIREELETVVLNAENTAAIFKALGYAEVARFEKRRESWTLDGLHVELDEVPHLGCFVEIEGPDEPSIRRAREKLGLGGTAPVTESYVGMLMRWLEQQGSGGPRVVVFPNT